MPSPSVNPTSHPPLHIRDVLSAAAALISSPLPSLPSPLPVFLSYDSAARCPTPAVLFAPVILIRFSRTQLSLLQRQNDSLLAQVQRLETVLGARRSSVSTAAQTLYDPAVVSPVASPLHMRRSAAADDNGSGGVSAQRQRTSVEPASSASASHHVYPSTQDLHDNQLRQQQQMQQHKEQHQQHQQHQQQQLLALQRELALAQQELSSARHDSASQVLLERQLKDDRAAAVAAAAAGEIHQAGLDAILERLGSWDADVLAEVYRNGQLTAMYAPQHLQQHQQQLLAAPSAVTDVSISMKCVFHNLYRHTLMSLSSLALTRPYQIQRNRKHASPLLQARSPPRITTMCATRNSFAVVLRRLCQLRWKA